MTDFCLGRTWMADWVVLFDDSTFVWFRNTSDFEPRGCVYFREAPELIAAGEWTAIIPNRPALPEGYDLTMLMAFGSRHRSKVLWLLARSEEQVNSWMEDVCRTLPVPPPRLNIHDPVTYNNILRRLEQRDTRRRMIRIRGTFSTISEDQNHSNPQIIFTRLPRLTSGNIDPMSGPPNALNMAPSLLPSQGALNWGRGWGWWNWFQRAVDQLMHQYPEILMNIVAQEEAETATDYLYFGRDCVSETANLAAICDDGGDGGDCDGGDDGCDFGF